MSRKCLRGASFGNATIATQEIEAFIRTYDLHMAHPFEWKKGVRVYKRLKGKDCRSPGTGIGSLRYTGNYDPDEVLVGHA